DRHSGDRQNPLHCRDKRYRTAPVPQPFPNRSSRSNEKRRRPRAPPLSKLKRTKSLAERVRHVVERGVQLVADALHRTDRRNGDESRDQTIFNGGRALFVLNQLQKLRHLRSPTMALTIGTTVPAIAGRGPAQAAVKLGLSG